MLKNKKISDLKTNNLTGLKIGKLTVIGISEFRNKHNRIMWDCICDCGNKKSIPADMLNKTLRGETGSKSCGCLRNNAHNKIKDRLDACYRQIYNSTIVKRSKRKGLDDYIDFNLFKELANKNCTYCGDEPNNCFTDRLNKNYKVKYSGIDRIDSNIGYIKNNVVPCCNKCNTAKSILSQNEFKDLIIKIYNNYVK